MKDALIKFIECWKRMTGGCCYRCKRCRRHQSHCGRSLAAWLFWSGNVISEGVSLISWMHFWTPPNEQYACVEAHHTHTQDRERKCVGGRSRATSTKGKYLLQLFAFTLIKQERYAVICGGDMKLQNICMEVLCMPPMTAYLQILAANLVSAGTDGRRIAGLAVRWSVGPI